MDSTVDPPYLNDMLKSATIYRNSEFDYVYVCYHCGFSFTNITDTLNHVESHFNVNLYNNSGFSSDVTQSAPGTQYTDIDRIQESHHFNQCQLCCEKFNAIPLLIFHLMKDHAHMTTLACPQCSENCEDEATFSTHLLRHIDSNETNYDALIDEIILKCKETNEFETEDNTKYSIQFLKPDNKYYNLPTTDPKIPELENKTLSESDSEIDSDAEAEKTFIPEKSKQVYAKAYENFKNWCDESKLTIFDESVLLEYFTSELHNFKSSTAWSIYSKLKATLRITDNVNLGEYKKLRAFLKQKSRGYEAKKSKVFTKVEFIRFIKEAPDYDYLAIKVSLILGVYGGCRRDDLVRMSLHDIEFIDSGIKITISKSKDKVIRQFVIEHDNDLEVNMIDTVKKYIALRPKDTPTMRFFIGYRNGKCTRQPIGINTIAKYPERIAIFLQLSCPGEYTGNCFRRTSTSLLSDTNGRLLNSNRQPRVDQVQCLVESSPSTVIKTEANVSPPSDCESDVELLPVQPLLPETSRPIYEKTYKNFKKWCDEKEVKIINETILLEYFSSEINNFKSSTAWCVYSMLRATLELHDNIFISDYTKLKAYLKQKRDGYLARKSEIFTKEQFIQFMKEAPDYDYLCMKVSLIVGVYGACRRDDLVKMTLNDVEYIDSGIKITIPEMKGKVIRQFQIEHSYQFEVNVVDIVKKYIDLRPDDTPHTRLFIGYRNGKCTRQPVGVNTIAKYPERIAKFLQLPSASEYTGNSFRRSSATVLSNLNVKWSIVKKRKMMDHVINVRESTFDQSCSNITIKTETISDLSDSSDSVDIVDSIDPLNSIEPVYSNSSIKSNEPYWNPFN